MTRQRQDPVLDGEVEILWMKAHLRKRTWVEFARQRRLCRICGEPIRKGGKCMVTDDRELRRYYRSSKNLSVHFDCFANLLKKMWAQHRRRRK